MYVHIKCDMHNNYYIIAIICMLLKVMFSALHWILIQVDSSLSKNQMLTSLKKTTVNPLPLYIAMNIQ